jgi:hypothetical protein
VAEAVVVAAVVVAAVVVAVAVAVAEGEAVAVVEVATPPPALPTAAPMETRGARGSTSRWSAR